MVTDTIERFTPDGVELASGNTLDADIVVTATGLRLLALGGVSSRSTASRSRSPSGSPTRA